jgi:3-hydroxybenzoate 6-monooxygenase
LGGLAAAYALAQDGHQVMVLEQSSGFGEIGAGIQLGPKQLPDVRLSGSHRGHQQGGVLPGGPAHERCAQRGEGGVDSVGRGSASGYGYPYGVIYRADLHQVLLDACRILPNITLRPSAKVDSFEQAAGSVRVQLVGGKLWKAPP